MNKKTKVGVVVVKGSLDALFSSTDMTYEETQMSKWADIDLDNLPATDSSDYARQLMQMQQDWIEHILRELVENGAELHTIQIVYVPERALDGRKVTVIMCGGYNIAQFEMRWSL